MNILEGPGVKTFKIMMTTHYTAFRCPVDLLAKAKAKAARDRRSLSKYLVLMIEKYVGKEPMRTKGKMKHR